MVRRKLVTASFLAMMLVFASGLLPAQESQRQNPPATNSVEKTSQSNEKQLTETSKEAGEKSETEKLQESPAVKFIGRITGLEPAKAYWLSVGLNFAAVLVVLWLLLRKSLPATLKSRSETIQKRLEEARKTGEDARRRLSEVEARLSRLDSEIAAMQQETEAGAKAEEERTKASAEEERLRIVHSAEQEIAMAATAARRELKAYAADLAVSLAEKKINVGPGTDQALVRDFTAQLGKDGN